MRRWFISIALISTFGCSAAPDTPDEAPVEAESPSTSVDPEAEALKECPCGDGREDWENPPPGAKNPRPEDGSSAPTGSSPD